MDADEKSGRKKAKLTLEDVFGSVKPLSRPEDFKKIRGIVMEERAQRQMQILRDSRSNSGSPTK